MQLNSVNNISLNNNENLTNKLDELNNIDSSTSKEIKDRLYLYQEDLGQTEQYSLLHNEIEKYIKDPDKALRYKDEIYDILSVEQQKVKDNSPLQEINYHTESIGFSKDNLNAISGSIVSAQLPNQVQMINHNLLS